MAAFEICIIFCVDIFDLSFKSMYCAAVLEANCMLIRFKKTSECSSMQSGIVINNR